MIRCTLELIPGGVGEPEQLGVIMIDNNLIRSLADSRRGDYNYVLYKKRSGRSAAKGVIRDFPRLSYHPWNLVRKMLNDAASQRGGTI